jgi:hypothetical protein
MTPRLIEAIDAFVNAFPGTFRPMIRPKLIELIEAIVDACRHSK